MFSARAYKVTTKDFSNDPTLGTINVLVPIETHPCNPSPCGPNSQCREINGQAVCSCVPGFIGSPPACRPECVVSSECPLNNACVNQKCVDPCPGTCGISAVCQVVNHNPICSCPQQMTGDPFTRCIRKKKICRVKQFSKTRSCRGCPGRSPTAEPLPTFALRAEFSMQGFWRRTFLLLPTRIHRNPAKL